MILKPRNPRHRQGHYLIFFGFIMVEVIHRYDSSYPFGLEKENEHTFVEVLKENLSEEQINAYRLKNKIMREMEGSNFIKLIKIFKEERALHLLYEYFPISLGRYIENLTVLHGNHLETSHYRNILSNFTHQISHIIEMLVHYQIKSDLLVCNLAVAGVEGDSFTLKVFIDPDSQCLGLSLPFLREQHEMIRVRVQENRLYLQEFYEAERKRLVMEIQEMFEYRFGRLEKTMEVNQPNFVINGSKLVFIRSDNRREEKRMKNCAENEKCGDTKIEVRPQPNRVEILVDAKKEIRDKNTRKIQEIKQNLSQLSHKAQHINPFTQNYCDNLDNRRQNPSQNYQDAYEEVVFKPEEITNDKTAILEEKEYLQSLEDELEKMNYSKKLKEERSRDERKVTPERPVTKESGLPKRDSRKSQQNTISSKFQQLKATDKSKDEKINKYKMKIITSHEIEIEGAPDQNIKQVEKDIVEGIRSGKINVNDLASASSQRQSNLRAQTEENNRKQQEKTQQNKARQNEGSQEVKMNSRNSDMAAKSKRISEIIDKINQKSSNTTAERNQNGGHAENRHEKIIRHNTVCENDGASDNYYDKIKEARSKAEQVLKDYAKAKKQ